MSEIVLSCGRRCRVVLDTSREFRQYVPKCVPYIFGLDMVSSMTTYTSMIARFCAETFDWNEMVGDWVCGLGEDDCWIYLCPMMSLGFLPLATNEEPLPPYFERLVSGDLQWPPKLLEHYASYLCTLSPLPPIQCCNMARK